MVEEIEVVRGRSRVDVALVGEGMHGFEIKSRVDTLSRLSRQLEDYRAVFDQISVVIGVNHLTKVLGEIPNWCGVLLATTLGGEVLIEPFREARLNPHRQSLALAQLLWRDEALGILERRGFARGVRSKPRRDLWNRLSETLALEDLAAEVRAALRARPSSWRVDSREQVFSEIPGPTRARRKQRSRRKKRA